MAYYNKFVPKKKGSTWQGKGTKGDKSFGRGGTGDKPAEPGRREGRGSAGEQRFGPRSQPGSGAAPGSRYGDQPRGQGYGKPAYPRRKDDGRPQGRPQQGRPYAPAPPSQGFGPRPAQPRPSFAAPPDRQTISPPPVQPAAPPAMPENLLIGRNPIREALKTGRDIEKLLVASGELSGSAREILSMAKNAGIVVQTVERSRLDQITRNHQGMLAFASAYPYASLEDILASAKEKGEDPFIIILDKVTDPQNLGAIIRTAACVGAHGVVVQLHRAVGLTPSAVRASAGAVEHVKVARVVNINNTIRSMKDAGIWVYAADPSGSDYRQVKFSGACALVIGSEGEGVSALTLSLCDQKVSIPMSGVIDSLNASVAAGILMYAAYTGRSA